jgi:hypothetical protein
MIDSRNTNISTSQPLAQKPRSGRLVEAHRGQCIVIGDEEHQPLNDFAAELKITPKTLKKYNLPTSRVGGILYIARKASLKKIFTDKTQQRNEPPQRRRQARR